MYKQHPSNLLLEKLNSYLFAKAGDDHVLFVCDQIFFLSQAPWTKLTKCLNAVAGGKLLLLLCLPEV